LNGMDRHLTSEYEDLSAHIKPAVESNMFGRIMSGSIILKTKMIQLPSDSRAVFEKWYWTVSIESAYLAHCNVDWVTPWPGDSIIQSGYALWMMLLASSCSGPSFSDDEEDHDSNKEGHSSDEQHNKGHPETVSSSLPRPKASSRSSEESEDQHIFIKRCRQCNDKNHNTHAWGLLLVESEEPGKYIRVGVFTSRAAGLGGTNFFADVPLTSVEII